MKNIFLLVLIVLLFGSISSAQSFRNDGNINISGGYLVITGTSTSESNAALSIDGTLTLTGDWINNSTGTVISGTGTNGTVIFKGTTTQIISGTAPQSNFENITLDPLAIVDIPAGKYVTVNNTTTNNGTLNLRSDAGGTASLITGSSSGAGTNAERYITGGLTGVAFWHNLSSPVSGQRISDFVFDPANNVPVKFQSPDTLRGIEFYEENPGKWSFFNNTNLPFSSLQTFETAKGYMVRRNTNGVVTFTGTLNAGGSFGIAGARTKNGWNAVGNPYSSSLGINDGSTVNNFISTNLSNNNLDPSYFGAYFWNGSGYSIINNSPPVTFIQPFQGFLVKVSEDNGLVEFESGMQAHGNPVFYKKSSSVWSEILLNVQSSSNTAKTKILFREDMTRGLDISYDGGIFRNGENLVLYTSLVIDNGVDFSVQCLPSLENDSMLVPVGLDFTSGGLVSFSADISNLPAGYIAVLEDRLHGIFTDLAVTGGKYEVAVDAGSSGTGRFFLHTVEGSNGILIPEKPIISIFAFKKEIFINVRGSETASAGIYDLLGRKLANYKLDSVDLNILNMADFKDGIYIVKVSDKGILNTTRVFIGE